ncbi:hypothetical protein [Capnocytophaga canimorsus]|uniref:Uncharacterized protein n=1 Tax=Capnocytophaga canimorsus (strain 5) TaxID=860228 RepID=F9YSM7_CAPCC|nr:hypothetical protein [Capnocytophaga canimorsus]AEK22700.1 Hypothetical protein Ccan_05800 [Capnocytophaga canimorsus Cc5]
MRVGGIIALIFGVLNLIMGLASFTQFPNRADNSIGFGIAAIVLGLYLLSRDKKNKEDQRKKDQWSNGI